MPPPASKASVKNSESAKKVVSIEEYAAKVLEIALGSTNCMAQITADLGSESFPLHMFISLMAIPSDFFGKVLQKAAKELKTSQKTTVIFLQEYIETLESGDFLYVNGESKLDAYGLACARDQLNIAKPLLVKGLELGGYSANTDSIFEFPLKFNSSNILKYLFTEQESITINWHYVLLKAIKYANVETISYYAQSEEEAIQVTTDRRGDSSAEKKKYNILNKALDSLVELAQLERFKAKEAQMDDAIKKIPLLCECIKIMIDSDRIYYAVDNLLVGKKTLSLLKELNSAIKRLPTYKSVDALSLDELGRTMNDVKDLVITRYKAQPNLPLNSVVEIDRIESGIEDDTASQATYVTNFSVLSGIGDGGRDAHESNASAQVMISSSAYDADAVVSNTPARIALLGANNPGGYAEEVL